TFLSSHLPSPPRSPTLSLHDALPISQLMRNSEFVERFKREARAAGRLRHPNVVDVTDFGFSEAGQERVAYLVMEYLDGCTLSDRSEEHTSELQSRFDLVCRLLLEKKK